MYKKVGKIISNLISTFYIIYKGEEKIFFQRGNKLNFPDGKSTIILLKLISSANIGTRNM